jgi:hypothetical protein
MKTGQWVLAVVVLATMVFAITFGMNYLGSSRDSSSTKGPPKEGLRLTFPVAMYPTNTDSYMMCEYGRPGSCYFWFENPHAREVKVGLVEKSCQCSRVFYHPASPETPAKWVATQAGLAAAGPLGPLNVEALAAYRDDWADEQLSQRLGEGTELTPATAQAVPPGALGIIHLTFKTERPEQRNHDLTLWTDTKANGIRTKLQARTYVIKALQVPNEFAFGTLTDKDLPARRDLYFFSPTRSSLQVKLQVVSDGRKPENDTFQVGPITPATDAESAKSLGLIVDEFRIPVRCAYKVTVTVGANVANGSAPSEVGVIRRYLEFKSTDEGVEPEQVPVTGRIESLVKIGNVSNDGHVVFGPFPAERGAERKVLLESDVPGLELEVDQTRLPPFLEVPRLEKFKPRGAHQSWRLTLRVMPNKANGRFPDPAVDAVRDSAVYIKATQKDKPDKPRLIRIPLAGTGNIS